MSFFRRKNRLENKIVFRYTMSDPNDVWEYAVGYCEHGRDHFAQFYPLYDENETRAINYGFLYEATDDMIIKTLDMMLERDMEDIEMENLIDRELEKYLK